MSYEELAPGVRLVRGAMELVNEPKLWTIALRDGHQIVVIAHGYRVEGDDAVFSLLFRGSPHFEVESFRVPLELMPDGFS